MCVYGTLKHKCKSPSFIFKTKHHLLYFLSITSNCEGHSYLQHHWCFFQFHRCLSSRLRVQDLKHLHLPAWLTMVFDYHHLAKSMAPRLCNVLWLAIKFPEFS